MIEDLKMRTCTLERTRGFFTGRSDEPYSGAARFEPYSRAALFELADSGAASLRSVASTEATCSLVRSGADPPASATAGVGPWPPPATREAWTSGAPPPRISNDCRRHGAAPDSTACGALGVDAEFVDFPRDRRLCRESESGGQSHRKASAQKPTAPRTFSGGQVGGVRFSATRGRPSRWAPH
jgi:hypothetical protein